MSSSDRPSYTLDHVCLAVRKIGPARDILERTLAFYPRTDVVENSRQMVQVQFMAKHGSIDIKLIAPSCPESPLVEFIKKTGGGLHHLAFRTESVVDGANDLQSRGARIVTAPQPGEAFDDALISFAYLGSGLNVELIDTEHRRSTIIETNGSR
jgi:methylmalonyl-CoA/ethylmalonyl-CoA epimerase